MLQIRTVATACLVALLAGAPALAQTPSPAPSYEPKSGQAGKDVVWVPTQQALVDTMLNMAKATPEDYVIDLGSGDGRTVITAARRGIRALGIEYNPDLVALSRRAAEKEGVHEKATFRQADIFETDFSQATVLTLFLLPELNLRLRPTILSMKPGTRVVSNTFTMGEWEADQTIQLAENCSSYCRAFLWIVPAKVEGSWRLPDGELKLTQQFQKLTGTIATGGKSEPIEAARVDGTEIRFSAGGRDYVGTVDGGRITGTSTGSGAPQDWSATRS